MDTGLVAVILTAIGGTFVLGTLLAMIRGDLKALGTEIKALDNKISSSNLQHAMAFAMANPGLKVPDPRDPTKLITVNVEYVSQGDVV